MTPYRKNILSCYCSMLATEFLLFKAAFQMHMHFEEEEMEQYLQDGYELSRDMIEGSDDPVVARINAFLTDVHNFIIEMEERNQLSAEDIDDGDIDDEEDDEKDKEVKARKYIGLVIFLLNVRMCSRTEKALRSLCEIKNEVSPVNFKDTWQYNDDNIQSIAFFYTKLSAMLDYLEKETNSIEDKRNW